VLSLPPDAPIATFSPRWKSEFVVIVWWISVSNTEMKQVLHSFEWSFGRRMSARFTLHSAQVEGGIFGVCRVEVCKSDSWWAVGDGNVQGRIRPANYRYTLDLPFYHLTFALCPGIGYKICRLSLCSKILCARSITACAVSTPSAY
jgi:hypothetical protein